MSTVAIDDTKLLFTASWSYGTDERFAKFYEGGKYTLFDAQGRPLSSQYCFNWRWNSDDSQVEYYDVNHEEWRPFVDTSVNESYRQRVAKCILEEA